MAGFHAPAVLPRRAVERLRLFLLLLTLCGAAVVMPRVLFAPEASVGQRICGASALVLLCLWWAAGCRRGHFPAWTLPLEGLAFLVVGTPLGGPLDVLGFMILSLAFRSAYETGAAGLMPVLTYAVTLLAGTFLAPLYAAPPEGNYQLFQTAALGLGVPSWLLANSLSRQEQALQRQDVLARVGARLVAAASREDIISAGEAAVGELLPGRAGRLVELDDPATGSASVQLSLAGHGGPQAMLLLDGGPPEHAEEREPLEALCALIALRLETQQEAQARERTAESRAERLAELNQLKDELLDSVSHELRSPLTSIQAYSELLLTYRDAAVQHEFLEIINSESKRLGRLVSDVLDLRHIQSGSFVWNMERVDVGRLLNDAARIYGPLVACEGLEFDLGAAESLPPVHGDRDRLLHVLGNLLNNALKFTIRGSVGLAAYQASQEVHVAVSDSGVGVAAEDRERIFDKFQQAGRAPRGKAGGTGLGLAICRQIVEHHNGRIWVSPAPRGGSVFTVALPAVRPDEPAGLDAGGTTSLAEAPV